MKIQTAREEQQTYVMMNRMMIRTIRNTNSSTFCFEEHELTSSMDIKSLTEQLILQKLHRILNYFVPQIVFTVDHMKRMHFPLCVRFKTGKSMRCST